MKTLEILLEEFVPRIYKNISPSTLMNLSKEHGTTRFHISYNKIYAGDANNFGHSELHDEVPEYQRKDNYDKDFVDGMIHYNKKIGKHSFYGNSVINSKWGASNHPILKKLENKGAIRSDRETLLNSY